MIPVLFIMLVLSLSKGARHRRVEGPTHPLTRSRTRTRTRSRSHSPPQHPTYSPIPPLSAPDIIGPTRPHLCNFYPSCPKGSTNYDKFCKTNPITKRNKININAVLTKGYENEKLRRRGKNKPNSNPIKPNFLDTQMNVSTALTSRSYLPKGRTSRTNPPKKSER